MFACIHSRRGSSQESLEWLRRAISVGFSNIPLAKRDPDLESLRRLQQAEFEKCVKIDFSWNVIYGFFNDDIVLRNASSFPFTNIELDVELEQGEAKLSTKLQLPLLRPGDSHTWQNAVSIPKSKLTKSNATLTCDQSR